MTSQLLAPEALPDGLLPLRFREFAQAVLLTNDLGEWWLATRDQLDALPAASSQLARELERRFAVPAASGDAAIRAAERLRRRYSHLRSGPTVHVLVLEGADPGRAMPAETARRALDVANMSSAERLRIELVADDPLEHAVAGELRDWAQAMAGVSGREIEVVDVVREPARVTSAAVRRAGDRKASLRLRIDDDALSDDGAPSAQVISALCAACGERVEGYLECTARTLAMGDAPVDRLIELGLRRVELRAPEPYPWPGLGEPADHTMEEWLAWYEGMLARLVERSVPSDGRPPLAERTAATFLSRMLEGQEPFAARFRSPACEGVGELAYAPDGTVYASAEGLRLGELGDRLFALGEVHEHGYRELVTHPTVRSSLLATTLAAQPDCSQCAFMPFCGQRPVRNYAEQGSLHGRMRDSSTCRQHKGVQDMLWRWIHQRGPEVFAGWVAQR